MHRRHHRDQRDRSRSPRQHQTYRERSRSPRSDKRNSHAQPKPQANPASSLPVKLPFQARPLRKHDYRSYKPMFELYLEIQKHKVLDELPEDEVKGRWKSYIGKWNRGELAEGWYDPATLHKAQASAAAGVQDIASARYEDGPRDAKIDSESEDEELGPCLPAHHHHVYGDGRSARSGPAIPNMQDLELQKELVQDDVEAAREDLRHQRRLDRRLQKERLDELVPRAEASTKDRQLEKKREKADSNRAFAAAKTEGDGVADVPESDLLGDDGGVEGFKKRKAEVERRKNERELRKEEILRARAEEREERLRAYKEKESRTMSGLVALAKAKFG